MRRVSWRSLLAYHALKHIRNQAPSRGVLNFGHLIQAIFEKLVGCHQEHRIYPTNQNKVQLCHAYQRWNDVGTAASVPAQCPSSDVAIDLARDIYKNISSEKLLFLRIVQEHEEELLRTLHEWKVPLAVNLILRSCFVS